MFRSGFNEVTCLVRFVFGLCDWERGRFVRILVTGGAGRLGRSVVAVLAGAGHEVLSVDRDAASGLPVEQATLDLTDRAATHEVFTRFAPVAVIHLAAISVPFSAPEHVIYETNTRLAFTVFEAAVNAGVSLVLAASSPTVVGYGSPSGWLPTSLPIDETHQLAPWNAYSLSKQAIENAAAMFARVAGNGTTFGVFRPCFVISPEEWQGAPTQQGHTVLERLQRPELAAVSLFNYVDSRDAADFVLAWLAHAGAAPNGTAVPNSPVLPNGSAIPNGSVFFVGAADALATRPLAELVPRYLPGSSELAAALTGDLPAFSSAKAELLLGWRASRSWRSELPDAAELGASNLIRTP
jgi:UDP-glucose 4-epimerase